MNLAVSDVTAGQNSKLPLYALRQPMHVRSRRCGGACVMVRDPKGLMQGKGVARR
jgi:hypothetical protein